MMLLIVEIHLGLFLLLVWYRVEDLNSVGESSAELLYIKATDQDRQQRYTHQQKKNNNRRIICGWLSALRSDILTILPYEATFSRFVWVGWRHGARAWRRWLTTAASRHVGALAPHLSPHLILSLSLAHTPLLLPLWPHPHIGPTCSLMPFTQPAGHSTDPTPIQYNCNFFSELMPRINTIGLIVA
jgi:hypothetical protein